MLRIIEVFSQGKDRNKQGTTNVITNVAHIPDEYHVDQHVVTE